MQKDIGLIIARILAFLTSLFLIFLIALPSFVPKENDKLEDKTPVEEKEPEDDIEEPKEEPEKKEFLKETIQNLVPNNNNKIETEEGQLINLGTYGIRYQGSNPDNYIYFNCSDDEKTCELWRIIGIVDGKVKIIKNESIGQYAWNTNGTNNWVDSSLNTYLNNEYLTSIEENSRTMISSSTWYLKGLNTSDISKDKAYELERTTGSVYGNNPETITNTKVGLMYPSDFGFAALESNICLKTTTLFKYIACKENNWLAKNLNNILMTDWFISHWSSNNVSTFVNVNDVVGVNGVHNLLNVRPVVYLKNEVEILNGEGTISNPFEITLK